jgi:hypothetical protein
MMTRQEDSRGQTIPFYVVAVIISLALSLFVMNYTNTIRWHIRAQNAADEAALAMIAGDANVANQISEAQVAAILADYNVHSVIYSMMNAANGVGTNPQQSDFFGARNGGTPVLTQTCDPSNAGNGKGDDTGVACDDAYDQEPAVYDQAVQQYASAVATLAALQSTTALAAATPAPGVPTGAPTAPPGSGAAAAFSLIANGTSCWDTNPQAPTGAFDCAFWYKDDLQSATPPWLSGTDELVEVTACRQVTSVAPHFIALNLPGSFRAAALAAATLKLNPTTFKPGQEIDPLTGQKYAPVEDNPPAAGCNGGANQCGSGWLVGPAYQNDRTPLVIQIPFYTPALALPPRTLSVNCKPG